MQDFINNLIPFKSAIRLLCLIAGLIALVHNSWTAVAICGLVLAHDLVSVKHDSMKELEEQSKAVNSALEDMKEVKSTITIIRNKMGFNKL